MGNRAQTPQSMSLFFSKKNPQTGKQPVKKRDVSMMICPECQHQQPESKIAVSTHCRSCGSYYKIIDGKAVTESNIPINPFTSARSEQANSNTTHDGQTPELHAASTPQDPPHNNLDAPAPRSQTEALDPIDGLRSKLAKKVSSAGQFFQRKIESRKVKCLECKHEHDAPAEASSTLCPACGAYVSLKNYIISTHWNGRIETRGNVTIQKKATVTDITVRCHNIVVLGTLKGGIDCSGDITLNSNSKIMGNVSCRRLIIDKRANVAFANEVECEEAIIDGHVTGHFICKGKLHLKNKAVLNGNMIVANMTIDKGARHNGQISIQQQ